VLEIWRERQRAFEHQRRKIERKTNKKREKREEESERVQSEAPSIDKNEIYFNLCFIVTNHKRLLKYYRQEKGPYD
jgi:hypothetical protein